MKEQSVYCRLLQFMNKINIYYDNYMKSFYTSFYLIYEIYDDKK